MEDDEEYKIVGDNNRTRRTSEIGDRILRAKELEFKYITERMKDKKHIHCDNLFSLEYDDGHKSCGLMIGIDCLEPHCSSCNFILLQGIRKVKPYIDAVANYVQNKALKDSPIDFENWNIECEGLPDEVKEIIDEIGDLLGFDKGGKKE